VVGEGELGKGFHLGEVEGVEIGVLVPPHPVGVDQPQHRGLLGGGHGGQRLVAAEGCAGTPFAAQPPEVLLDLAVGGVPAAVAVHLGQRLEALSPLLGHAARVLQPGLVETFYERGVTIIKW
jgi:hypothetical protein